MKSAIDMLRSKAVDLRQTVKNDTADVHYYAKELAVAESNIRGWQAKARERQEYVERACLRRNENQRVLNEIEAAIAKLEAD